jgi:hydroxymethylbilane synthase
MKLRIGTRGSQLARTQSTTIALELAELGHETELVTINTAGDLSDATSFGAIGPTGVFVREIERALLDNVIDVAVHSFKDLPTDSPADLAIASIPQRVDAADTLVMTADAHNNELGVVPIKSGARVGTASARRQAWLKHLRPDLQIEPIRGNVPTRIRRLREGFDGIVLAAAGLERLRDSSLDDHPTLDLDDRVMHRLDPEIFVPSPAQGALALQCRAVDREIIATLNVLAHSSTQICVAVERALLTRVEGGCDLAFGAYCTETGIDGTLDLIAALEHNGQLIAAKAQDKNPKTLVDIVWATLQNK